MRTLLQLWQFFVIGSDSLVVVSRLAYLVGIV
jgi:hypothetical protein